MKLKLTDDEAKVLAAVCAKVGGDPNGPRGSMDRLCKKLREKGYKWQDHEVLLTKGGSIYMKDTF